MRIRKRELLTGKKKNALISILMLISFFVLLPSFVKIVNWQMAPYTKNEVVITTISYRSEVDGEEHLIVGNLFQPSPKFSDKEYPAIIACHGFLMGIGKESMHRWCVELTKRKFVVLSIDLPGSGMSIGEMDALPREDLEPEIVKDGIRYLKGLEFVDDSKIGLIGISYGGATVAMCASVLGDLIDATVCLNGFTNFTNWLIEGILEDADVDFSVSEDYIAIKKIGDTKVTKHNIKDLLKLYGIIRGDEKNMKELIIPGTNRLDRDFLKKFDAVEYLPDVKDDSILFVHAKRDKTYDKTNQSGQGYEAIINADKEANYVRVDDNHQLTDDPDYTSDYCLINFFEEKLKYVDLDDNWDDDFEKYSQERNIKLTFATVFGFPLLYEWVVLFLISIIPFFLIISIIFYNKKIATKRAISEKKILNKKSKDKDFVDLSFGGGSFAKTIYFLVLLYLIGFTAIIGISLGFFSELIAGTLCAAFYLVLYLTLYYLPDQAEIDLWKQFKEKENPHKSKSKNQDVKTLKFNRLIVLFVFFAVIIAIAFVGSLSSFMPKFFNQPIEQIISPMLIMGSIFLLSGILFIYFLEKKENKGISFKKIDWGRYTLDKYKILNSITFGSVLFLNLIFQWNIWAFFMKFPMTMGPHSIYYLYAVMAIVLFFAGIQLMVKFMKEKFLKYKINVSFPQSPKKEIFSKVLIEVLATLIGILIISLVVFIAFIFLLNSPLITFFFNLQFNARFNTSFSINAILYLTLIFAAVYLITNIVKIFCVNRGVFGVSVFLPLILFTIIAFFLHI